MSNDSIMNLVGYKYYMAKKVESKNAKIIDEPEEQHVSPVKSGRGKGFMCYGDQVVNVPNKPKKDVVPRKTRSLAILEETVVVAGEGLSAGHNKYNDSPDTDSDAILNSSNSNKIKESANKTNDANEFDIYLSNDNPHRDDDDAGTKGNVYLDLRIKSVVRIVVKKKWCYGFLTSIVVRRSNYKEYEFSYPDLLRLNLNDVEDMYLVQVQDKLQHLPMEFVKDFNNVLLLFIRRVVIQNKVEDIQLGVESYQQTLKLTKPMMFFKGIDQRIPFTLTTTHKVIAYLNQHNVKSLMKLS
nr:hypothetical protein [Tanacetum cinerariifolium]